MSLSPNVQMLLNKKMWGSKDLPQGQGQAKEPRGTEEMDQDHLEVPHIAKCLQ